MVTIALNKQIKVYSVDTSYFYNDEENILHTKFKELQVMNFDKDINKEVKKANRKEMRLIKKKLKEKIGDNKRLRHLNNGKIKQTDIIAMFDSELSRAIGINANELSEDIIVVETFFFGVLEDLILHGFMHNGSKYVGFTASAGQIRQKKTLFVKESTLKSIYNRITCGLSVAEINSQGGVNINKYLAYLALCSSATEEWLDFDINKTIVVEDFESDVSGEVDYIDSKTFEITRKTMNVPVPHTDGCGIMLPKFCKKSRMVRMPWVKGLLVPFPFDKFIKNQRDETGDKNIGVVKDIYGKEHDILKDGIEVILTKSQFKMWRYYKDIDNEIDSWRGYQDKYIKYGCTSNFCNEEVEHFKNASLNYQMLQTLVDITDEELCILAQKTITTIQQIGSDRNTMLKVLGVTPYNTEKNNLQQALEIYPELLSDNYTKEVLKQTKASMVKRAKAGKIQVSKSKYTFLIPDLYAFCENLFLGEEAPKGLLKDKEVYCKLYSDNTKLDCLRSPHLFREHAIRMNRVDKERSEWFITNGIYTSSYDLITKLLMNDNDGDTSLVSNSPTLVDVAERNMKNVVPLYYEMGESLNSIITPENIYSSLTRAYTGGNIGEISNTITKIWNSEEPDEDLVKLNCLLNNFIIDYAKTLIKPDIPEDIAIKISSINRMKTPAFFTYAKNKHPDKVEPINNSTVNRLETIIPNKRLHFKAKNLGKIDYRKLMNKYSVKQKNYDEIIKKYNSINRNKRFLYNQLRKQRYETGDALPINEYIRNEMLKVDDNIYNIVDALVLYLYVKHPTRSRSTLWSSFGDVIVDNLNKNIKQPLYEMWVMCEGCGERIKVKSNSKKYCDKCAKINHKRIKRLTWHENKNRYRNKQSMLDK